MLYFVMTDEQKLGGYQPHVKVFLDDDTLPVFDCALPADLALDTHKLTDGIHRLVIRAEGQNGRAGAEEIPFVVRNGPGILVSGLRPNSVRSGAVRFRVDAFSTDDPFDPRQAEARAPIPVWVWVMALLIVAWSVWYAARTWDPPKPAIHAGVLERDAGPISHLHLYKDTLLVAQAFSYRAPVVA